MTSPLVSVVIPTFRRCASLQRALQSLAHQTLPLDRVQVVVAIDGSEDGTRETVGSFDAPFRLDSVWQSNRGRAAACNAGIRLAEGEVVVLLDDDMEPSYEFLAAHWQAHQGDEIRAIVGAAPIPYTESDPPIVRYMGDKFNKHLERLSQPAYRMTFHDFDSGNFSIRRKTLQEVGLFDERFQVYGNEDGELALRLLDRGIPLVYEPAALAYQHYDKSFAAVARDNFSKGQTSVQLAAKRPETRQLLKLSTYRRSPLYWYLVRAGLLRASRIWPGLPAQMVRGIEWLERRRVPRLFSFYFLSLDYFYWLGVGV